MPDLKVPVIIAFKKKSINTLNEPSKHSWLLYLTIETLFFFLKMLGRSSTFDLIFKKK